MVEKETKTAVGKMCFASDTPDEALAERGSDKDTPDRPLTTDDVEAFSDLPSVQSPALAGNEDDPWVRSLDSAERLLVALSERSRDPSGAGEVVGSVMRLAETPRIHRSTRVQLPDERLVGVVPLALGREAAERPDGDREREGQ